MSTRNFDSSLLTKRRQAKVLSGYYQKMNTAVQNGTSVRREQPTTQMAVFITERNLGKCYCAKDASATPYDFNPSGGPCGC